MVVLAPRGRWDASSNFFCSFLLVPDRGRDAVEQRQLPEGVPGPASIESASGVRPSKRCTRRVSRGVRSDGNAHWHGWAYRDQVQGLSQKALQTRHESHKDPQKHRGSRPKTLLRQALSCIIWKLPYLTKFQVGLVGLVESENPFGQTGCWPDEVHRLDDFALSHDDLSCQTPSMFLNTKRRPGFM